MIRTTVLPLTIVLPACPQMTSVFHRIHLLRHARKTLLVLLGRISEIATKRLKVIVPGVQLMENVLHTTISIQTVTVVLTVVCSLANRNATKRIVIANGVVPFKPVLKKANHAPNAVY